MNKKVLLGMSGGVDSSVAAALLKEQGYEVIGVTMRVWEGEDFECVDDKGCCSLSVVEDARRVANSLHIPHYVMDFKDIFKEKVVDYFKQEYLRGRTPNPCIACNRYIKFDALLNKALSMDIDYVATGHYGKVEYDILKDRYILKKAKDARKDQTYFLYNLTQRQLSRTLLPLGDYTKDEIRRMADDIGLEVVASKPDSQEICFIPDNDYVGFIERNIEKKIRPGHFVDLHGNILGEHKGIINYTIGQRKGLGISLGKPAYVVDIDPNTNTVVLGDNAHVFAKGLIASDLNFISIDRLESDMEVHAKIRYSTREASATISPIGGGRVKVIFKEPARAITPGQSVVFYHGDEVVGGGTIDQVER